MSLAAQESPGHCLFAECPPVSMDGRLRYWTSLSLYCFPSIYIISSVKPLNFRRDERESNGKVTTRNYKPCTPKVDVDCHWGLCPSRALASRRPVQRAFVYPCSHSRIWNTRLIMMETNIILSTLMKLEASPYLCLKVNLTWAEVNWSMKTGSDILNVSSHFGLSSW